MGRHLSRTHAFRRNRHCRAQRHDRHALRGRHRGTQVSDLDECADTHARRAHSGAPEPAERNTLGLPGAERCRFRMRVRSLPDGARRCRHQPRLDISRSLEQRHYAGDLDRRLRQRLQPEREYQRAYAQRRALRGNKKARGVRQRTLGLARPITNEAPFPLPPMRYPWADTYAALMALRENGECDPYDGIMIMLASPVDGGPTLPTIAWQAQLLSKKQKTLPHRHNSTTFYFAFEGEGAAVIENERMQYQQGDIFAVPAWTWHHHENTNDDNTILFSIDDWPAMKKLGFYMKEEAKGF